MRYVLIIIFLFLTSCASGNYTESGQKKDKFHPMFDPDCKRDNSIVKGFLPNGWVCAHDNGIIFVRDTLTTKFKIAEKDMFIRAQKFCDVYHENKTAKKLGKANLCTLCKLDYTGIEYSCM